MITLIAALGENRAIGLDGGLLWDLPGDLRRFRRLTMGGDLIMGRRTHESIGRPLDGRTNIVVSRRGIEAAAAGVRVVAGVDAALAACGSDRVFVIGGGEVYAAFLPHADRLELTIVADRPPADTWFPPLEPDTWTCESEQPGAGDPDHVFHGLVRRSGGPPATCLAALAG